MFLQVFIGIVFGLLGVYMNVLIASNQTTIDPQLPLPFIALGVITGLIGGLVMALMENSFVQKGTVVLSFFVIMINGILSFLLGYFALVLLGDWLLELAV